MVAPGKKPDTSTVRWIVHDNRLTDELGTRITKYAGKAILDKGPLEKPIEAMIINHLPYLNWADFAPIRSLLASSHKAGSASWMEGKGKHQI